MKILRIEQALRVNTSAAVSTAQEGKVARKVEGLRYALNVEPLQTKDQILAGYLNLAYYGDGAYGVEAAAEHYFARHATALTLPQAALLAGIVESPTTYNPPTHPSEALRRRNTVLNQMAQLGMITRRQAVNASSQRFDKRLVRTQLAGATMIAIDKRHPWWNSHRKSLKGISLPASGTWLEGTRGGDAGRHLWRPCMIAGFGAHTP